MKKAMLILAGILAVLLVLILVGPALVDWSRYRDQIAGRLEQATGREVEIAGPVGLRLLPAPAFSAERLSIGNPAGAGAEPMATVERLDIRLKLLPLLSGKVEITALALDKPVVNLVRLPDGRANWQFGEAPPLQPQPQPQPGPGQPSLKGEPPPQAAAEPDAFSVGNATITDGTLTYRSGDGKPMRLDAIDARVAAGGPDGPFSAEGRGRAEGNPIRFDAAIDRLAPGRGSPVNVALALPDSDARLDFAGMVSELSGGRTLHGRLTAAAPDPSRTLTALGKPLPLPPGPLAAEGTLTVSGDQASAADLVVTLGELRVTGTLGAAFGEVPQIEADLHVAALDLDKFATPRAPTAAPASSSPASSSPERQAPASAALPPAEDGFSLPDGLFVDLKLAADTIGWHGEVAREARIEATLAEGELVVRKLATQLPGGSTLAGEGTLASAKGKAVFDGMVRLASDNPRALLAWLGTDSDAIPAGRLTLASPVRVAWPEVALADFRLALGSDSTRGRLTARIAEPLALDLVAATEKFGEVTASATLKGNAVDARIGVAGVTATAMGSLGDSPRLTIAARHPNAAQLLRQFTDQRPRGPLGALALDAQLAGQNKIWDVSDLRLGLGALQLGGQARADLSGAKPLVTAELSGNDLALDPFLTPERTGSLLPGGPRLPPTLAPSPTPAIPAAAKGAEPPWSREPMDLGALNAVDARIGLRAASLSAKGWRLDNAVSRLTVQDGNATIEHLTGKLLGGDLSLVAKLAGGAIPALSGQLTVTGADIAATKPGAAGIAVTQGRLDADARFTAAGRSSFELVSRLDGDGKMLVKDGIITGFDLPAVNQRLNNLENVGSLLGLVQAGLSGGSTRFSSLAGTFRAKDGVVVTRDLKLDAQGGGATAESITDLPRWTTATTIAFRLADSSAPPLLVRLEGPVGNPRKVIDVNALQQFLVARGLGRALKGRDGGLVENLLGGKRRPPPEGQTEQSEQPPDQPPEKPSRVLRDLLKGLGGR